MKPNRTVAAPAKDSSARHSSASWITNGPAGRSRLLDVLKKGRLYTRVCQRCGTQWKLPRVLATEQPPNPRQLANTQRMAKFTIGGMKTRTRLQKDVFQTDYDRFIRNSTCPNCGTIDYRQYKPGDSSLPEPPRAMPAGLVQELQRLTLLRDTGQLSEAEYEDRRTEALERDRSTGW